MSQAIGILELTSITRGVEAGDVTLKSANVSLLIGKTICLEKFLLMLGSDVGAAQQVTVIGTSLADGMLVDSLMPPNIHASVPPAINGLNNVDKRQVVGIVKIWSAIACICAADRAVKASNVALIRVHMASGIGGKYYMVIAGDVSGVNNAVTVASGNAGERGPLVCRSVIPRPHESMWRQMMEG